MLNVKSSAPISIPHFPKFEKVSASRYHLEIKLNDTCKVDADLSGWLNKHMI
jgi:hypothetical protein